MMLPSSLLVSIFLFASSSLAQNDGQWHPEQYGGSGSNANANANAETTTAKVHTIQTTNTALYGLPTAQDTTLTTKATATATAAVAATAAPGDWQQQVTWPAGCESWANPCPPGAKISGGGVAGGATTTKATHTADYENGFTSYTTMTDSNGVITGMPTKATIAAGVEPSTLVSVTRNASVSFSRPSATQSGFSTGTDGPLLSENAAGRTVAVSMTSIGLIVAGLLAFGC